MSSKYNKPLSKNELNNIKFEFKKLGLKTDSYIAYLSKENTILKKIFH